MLCMLCSHTAINWHVPVHAEAASTWDSLIEEADQFVESSCATPELRQRIQVGLLDCHACQAV